MSCAMRTAMTRPYTAMIPDITTGTSDYFSQQDRPIVSLDILDGNAIHAFMMRSDLKVPTPEIPMPDLAVPYAAPIAESVCKYTNFPYNRCHSMLKCRHTSENHLSRGR